MRFEIQESIFFQSHQCLAATTCHATAVNYGRKTFTPSAAEAERIPLPAVRKTVVDAEAQLLPVSGETRRTGTNDIKLFTAVIYEFS